MAGKREGWYTDPEDDDPTAQRYWNGTQWTAHTRVVDAGTVEDVAEPPRSAPTSLAMPEVSAMARQPRKRKRPQGDESSGSVIASVIDEPSAASRVTLALVVVIVLLVAVASTESWYLWLRDDPVVSSARPVVASEVETASAVDSAAKALQQIVATSWKDYAEQTDAATKLMTESMAGEYRSTAEAIEDDFVAAKTEVKVEITHQGVVRASPDQVEALVFLTQYITKNGQDLVLTPFRAKVTVVNTDQGWLVSKIDTQ